MAMRRVIAAAGLASLIVAGPASAASTTCSFGGPAPGFKAVRLELPSGSSFLNTTLGGSRAFRGANTQGGWHLAQGIVILRLPAAAPAEIVAYRLRSEGSSPPRATVRRDGAEVLPATTVPAPDVAFTHSWALPVPSLDPGVYYAVAWGAGGRGVSGPPDAWGAELEVEGNVTCRAVGVGDMFDLDQNDFAGRTQVTAPGVAHMEGASLHRTWTDRQLVVGMIDAAVQGPMAGEARVSYATPDPDGGGVVDRALRPFVGPAGPYRFEATVTGAFPVVSVNGVRVDLG